MLAIAFCDRELLPIFASLPRSFESKKSSSLQNAATSTLKACAPQNSAKPLPNELLTEATWAFTRPDWPRGAESVRLGALW